MPASRFAPKASAATASGDDEHPPPRPSYPEREARRARSGRKLSGADRTGKDGDGCTTGHPPLFAMAPAFELGRIPEGGGYPIGFIEQAARLMGVTNLAEVLHLCSGSVKAPLTIDVRPESAAGVRADVRWLPIRPGSVRWVLVDPPYGQDYAEAIWGLGELYPTPAVLLRRDHPGAHRRRRCGLPPSTRADVASELVRVGTFGVFTGVGTRMRAFTVAYKRSTLSP